MKFEKVIDAFERGENITRKSWTAGCGGINYEWQGNIFTAEDIMADDWEVVD